MSGTQYLLKTLLRAENILVLSKIFLRTKQVPDAYFAELGIGMSVARARDQ